MLSRMYLPILPRGGDFPILFVFGCLAECFIVRLLGGSSSMAQLDSGVSAKVVFFGSFRE